MTRKINRPTQMGRTTGGIVCRFALAMAVGYLAACSGDSDPQMTAGMPDASLQSVQTTDQPVTTPTPSPPVNAEPATAAEVEDVMMNYHRPRDYEHTVSLPLQYIDTSVGKKLGVYVTLPANEKGEPAEGPFPVILVQSAYNLSMMSFLPLKGGILVGAPDPYIIKRGYALVAVDALGSGVSEGGWSLLGEEEQIAYGDVVDWVQQQPYFNGRLGAAGASYMAISSLFSAQQRPDAFDALFATVPMGDSYRGTVSTGGLLNGVFLSHWAVLTHTLTTQNLVAMLKWPEHYDTIWGATQEHIDRIDEYYLPMLNDALWGEDYLTYDSDYWRTRSPIHNIHKVHTPTLLTGGLHDIFQRDVPLLYEELKKNTDTRMFIHNDDHLGSIVNAMIGGDDVEPLMNLMLKWFDYYLKDIDSGVEQIPQVTQYVKHSARGTQGSGYVITSDWPHPLAEPERWYLRGDMGLTRNPPENDEQTHEMSVGPFAEIEVRKGKSEGLLVADIEIHDGTECSPSYWQWTLGAAGVLGFDDCFWDNSELAKGSLNFESATMEEDYFINGPVQADIWLESSVPDAVLSVRVDEVTPAGKSFPISNGLLLASARKLDETRSRFLMGEMIQPYHFFTKEHNQPLVPGEVVKLSVEIFSTSALIRKGNRLRISLAPSNQAQGLVNYPRRDIIAGGVTTIHNSAEFPSSVVLPIVPASELKR